MQGVDRLVDRVGRSEWTKIFALALFCAAIFGNARKGMVARNQDVGERLIVTQGDVVIRLETFDEIALKQECLNLAFRCNYLDRGDIGDHALQPRRQGFGIGVAGYALFQVFSLADIEHVAFGINHAIDAGAAWHRGNGFAERFKARRKRIGHGRNTFTSRDQLYRYRSDRGKYTLSKFNGLAASNANAIVSNICALLLASLEKVSLRCPLNLLISLCAKAYGRVGFVRFQCLISFCLKNRHFS